MFSGLLVVVSCSACFGGGSGGRPPLGLEIRALVAIFGASGLLGTAAGACFPREEITALDFLLRVCGDGARLDMLEKELTTDRFEMESEGAIEDMHEGAFETGMARYRTGSGVGSDLLPSRWKVTTAAGLRVEASGLAEPVASFGLLLGNVEKASRADVWAAVSVITGLGPPRSELQPLLHPSKNTPMRMEPGAEEALMILAADRFGDTAGAVIDLPRPRKSLAFNISLNRSCANVPTSPSNRASNS